MELQLMNLQLFLTYPGKYEVDYFNFIYHIFCLYYLVIIIEYFMIPYEIKVEIK